MKQYCGFHAECAPPIGHLRYYRPNQIDAANLHDKAKPDSVTKEHCALTEIIGPKRNRSAYEVAHKMS